MFPFCNAQEVAGKRFGFNGKLQLIACIALDDEVIGNRLIFLEKGPQVFILRKRRKIRVLVLFYSKHVVTDTVMYVSSFPSYVYRAIAVICKPDFIRGRRNGRPNMVISWPLVLK